MMDLISIVAIATGVVMISLQLYLHDFDIINLIYEEEETMKRSQLNAISRSYTVKARKQAVQSLADKGIDYGRYCDIVGYRGSPVKLLTSINSGAHRTMLNVHRYMKVINEE